LSLGIPLLLAKYPGSVDEWRRQGYRFPSIASSPTRTCPTLYVPARLHHRESNHASSPTKRCPPRSTGSRDLFRKRRRCRLPLRGRSTVKAGSAQLSLGPCQSEWDCRCGCHHARWLHIELRHTNSHLGKFPTTLFASRRTSPLANRDRKSIRLNSSHGIILYA